MSTQTKILSGGTVIDLDQGLDVVQPPVSANPASEEVWLMVMMADGTFTTIKGRVATEAFFQAMHNHHKAEYI